jgi:hypothetical protein
MMEAARTSETSVDNHFTRQYNPEDSSENYVQVVYTMITTDFQTVSVIYHPFFLVVFKQNKIIKQFK